MEGSFVSRLSYGTGFFQKVRFNIRTGYITGCIEINTYKLSLQQVSVQQLIFIIITVYLQNEMNYHS